MSTESARISFGLVYACQRVLGVQCDRSLSFKLGQWNLPDPVVEVLGAVVPLDAVLPISTWGVVELNRVGTELDGHGRRCPGGRRDRDDL